ncbi:hypothetical protein D3C76_1826900 [compost metagenome]
MYRLPVAGILGVHLSLQPVIHLSQPKYFNHPVEQEDDQKINAENTDNGQDVPKIYSGVKKQRIQNEQAY